MKTNKIYVTLGIIVSVLLIGYISVDAMNNYGYFKKFKSNSSLEHSPTTMIENVSKSDLTKDEESSLYYQYSEEKLAHDLYTYFYSLYSDQTFANIAESESKHMEAVKVLIDRYGLKTPTDYGTLAETYNVLKLEGEKSLQNALEVGIKVEMLDIEDMIKNIKITDNDDLKIVFINIGGASYNHIRGFVNGLDRNNLTTTVDYSAYLSADEINSKGPLKDKILKRFESEGIILSEVIKANIETGNHSGKGMGNGKGGNTGEGRGMHKNW